jgi:hypothetical protein
MIALKKALAEYIAMLDAASAAADQGENRGRYQLHLASAALMFAAMEKHQSVERLKVLIAGERRAYERSPLPGSPGKAATRAFNDFSALAEETYPAAPALEPEEKAMTGPVKEEKKRFEVQFELFPSPGGGMAVYQVFTHMGAAKAIVLAALKHAERKGHPILRVLPVKPLPGDAPQKKDLLDRLEW